MSISLHQVNPSSKVIYSLLQHKPSLSIYAKDMPYGLPAEVIELDQAAGRMVLETEYNGQAIDQYFKDGLLNFDIEALKLPDSMEREVYSLSNVPVKFLKTDSHLYRLECQLPESVFVKENRGAVRIPFIMGMQARVSVEIYLNELYVKGRLRNLSVGGCMIDIDIADSISLTIDQVVPGVTLEFPNGESFFSEGRIRHMRPFGNFGYAALGIQFIDLTASQSDALFHFVSECEREAACRMGIHEKLTAHSPLFIPGAKEKKILQREERDRHNRARQSPMQRGVLEVAHRLQIGVMYMNSRDFFPEEVFYDCVDSIVHMVGKDRKAFLYALACIRDEPDWVRHAVQVAGQLADVLLRRDPHSLQVREAVLGALLHTMGKPLLISEALPSLKTHMTPKQKDILKGHVVALKEKLSALNWTPSPVCLDIMQNANERLNGAGYPCGKHHNQLSELVKLTSVIKIINKLTHQRNGIPPRSPLDAYRWVHEASDTYEKTILVEYIQTYGLYPIGSLAKFSGGFLAWVMEIDSKGMPRKVNVIKNLAFKETNIDSVLEAEDFSLIGKLEEIVNPMDYGVRLIKL